MGSSGSTPGNRRLRAPVGLAHVVARNFIGPLTPEEAGCRKAHRAECLPRGNRAGGWIQAGAYLTSSTGTGD